MCYLVDQLWYHSSDSNSHDSVSLEADDFDNWPIPNSTIKVDTHCINSLE